MWVVVSSLILCVYTFVLQEIQEDIVSNPSSKAPAKNYGGGGGGGSRSETKLDIEGTVRMQAAIGYGGLQDLPSPSGRLSDRIERLRQRCTEALGREAFRDAYAFLKQHEEVPRVSRCSCVVYVYTLRL
jgi:hypothetical protein